MRMGRILSLVAAVTLLISFAGAQSHKTIALVGGTLTVE